MSERAVEVILRKLNEQNGGDPVDAYAKGWDKAIALAIHIVENATGTRLREVLKR